VPQHAVAVGSDDARVLGGRSHHDVRAAVASVAATTAELRQRLKSAAEQERHFHPLAGRVQMVYEAQGLAYVLMAEQVRVGGMAPLCCAGALQCLYLCFRAVSDLNEAASRLCGLRQEGRAQACIRWLLCVWRNNAWLTFGWKHKSAIPLSTCHLVAAASLHAL
jgi:hypothetical protein